MNNETEDYASSNDICASPQYPQKTNTKDISLQISPSRIMPDGQGFLLNAEYEEESKKSHKSMHNYNKRQQNQDTQVNFKTQGNDLQ